MNLGPSSEINSCLVRTTQLLGIILYFSILLHCIIQWVLQVMSPVCVQLYCVGFHCFTTCFGLHDHLQVRMIFYFRTLE
jgi:hypothetical protein